MEFNFITHLPVRLSANGAVALGNRATLQFDATRLEARVEEQDSTDARLRPVWGDRVRRIVLKTKPGAGGGNFTAKVVQTRP